MGELLHARPVAYDAVVEHQYLAGPQDRQQYLVEVELEHRPNQAAVDEVAGQHPVEAERGQVRAFKVDVAQVRPRA